MEFKITKMTDLKRQMSQTEDASLKDIEVDELFRLKESTSEKIRALDVERYKQNRLLEAIQRALMDKCDHKWEQNSPMYQAPTSYYCSICHATSTSLG